MKKKWDTINSNQYNEYILFDIQECVINCFKLIYMQNNTSFHQSRLTTRNFIARDIYTIIWFAYFFNLNFIEHVWNWIKNFIQNKYWHLKYNAIKLSLNQLRVIIWKAWNAILDAYIIRLINNWWDKCQTINDAKSDSTSY